MPKHCILFDAMVLYGARTGYSRVFTEMLLEFSSGRYADIDLRVLIQKGGLRSIEYSPARYPGVQFIVVPDIRSKIVRGLIEQILVPVYATLLGCDVVHMPATFGLFFPVRPTVLTFHTATSFALPAGYRGRDVVQACIHNALIHSTCRTAAILALTTNTTANELFTYLGKRQPYVVVGNGLPTGLMATGVRDRPRNELISALKGRKFALSVSQFYRLKNHNRVISAFVKAKKDGVLSSDWSLVLVGAVQEMDYYSECRALAGAREDILFFENVTDAELGYLYSNAALYIFLSIFEGFGMTPLEALAKNVPVVLSDIQVLKEVYGPGFVYVDPHSDSDVVHGIAAAQSVAYQNFCSGNPVCERYSWRMICGKYSQIYRNLAAKHRSV